ncbi:SDR family NAD(P)-dependent oxidoreductase [Afifella sp. IM 167]|uniref:SDR family NAD(P)-dependent oxidoreductase n=1 Tax=Afifella sp. IM 167 TaxID=2033586 RepID=UPI001CCA89F4|nr:SDR family NAD(P)-dependent oxidoreductase [Afifella sp. IM 167]MBZ8131919.1 oxidoreductase [Afifella sp. IM 167]
MQAEAPTSPAAKRAWITGGSTGIGRALALRLARDGWQVAVSARSADKLEALAKEAEPLSGAIRAFPLDVTDAEATARAFESVEAALGPLDLVFLNAGTFSPFSGKEFSVEAFRHTMEVNVMGTVHGLGPVIPRFLERGAGHIAVVASVAGYAGLPRAAAYGASKAALINMCEALRPDLGSRGVTLSLVNPGFVDTPMTEKNDFPMPFIIPVDKAVDAIMDGLDKKHFEIVFPWQMRLSMKLFRLLPYPLYFALTRQMLRKR